MDYNGSDNEIETREILGYNSIWRSNFRNKSLQ